MSGRTEKLPRWDMKGVFPGLASEAFERAFEAFIQRIDRLETLFDEADVGKRDDLEVDSQLLRTFERLLEAFNRVLDQDELLGAFVFGAVATDSSDELAQAKLSELEQQEVRLELLDRRLTAWLGSMDVAALIERSDAAADHEYVLRRAAVEAEHLMSPVEEELAARLSLTGSSAWNRLRGDVSSQLTVPLELEGEEQELPMSAVRNQAYEADRETRRRAYEAELATWEQWRTPLAASLNGVKGEVRLLTERRGWNSPLEQSLFHSAIDPETLEAMMAAATESFPDFRRYLQAKATALGLEQLAFYDLFAPMEAGGRPWSFADSKEFILENFATYSERLASLAQRAFEERWIDAEPRPGKRDNAFCMRLRGEESRILANFRASYDGMSTLAHELGHAYHNMNLAERTALQRQTPMTLAETASTFCQTIVQKEAIEQADESGQLYILEAALQDACQIVVDISSRFQFEQSIFEKREERPLSADEFCELMLGAQEATYGDGLDPEKRHPYMWAAKPHYYGGVSYYNYPYMFGLLFGLGLYARYGQEPAAFRANYDDLLSSTGIADAASLAGEFGIEVRSADFWRSSLNVVREDIDRFVTLAGAEGDRAANGM